MPVLQNTYGSHIDYQDSFGEGNFAMDYCENDIQEGDQDCDDYLTIDPLVNDSQSTICGDTDYV